MIFLSIIHVLCFTFYCGLFGDLNVKLVIKLLPNISDQLVMDTFNLYFSKSTRKLFSISSIEKLCNRQMDIIIATKNIVSNQSRHILNDFFVSLESVLDSITLKDYVIARTRIINVLIDVKLISIEKQHENVAQV